MGVPPGDSLLVGFGGGLGADSRDASESTQAPSAFESNLLSLLSHELRTPLMGVLNGALLLESERPPEQRTPGELLALEQIQRNGERLRNLIQSLMDLAVLDAGAYRPRLEEIQLEDWLQEHRSAFPQVNLKTSPTQAPSWKVVADPSKLLRSLRLAMQCLSRNRCSQLELSPSDRSNPSLALWFETPDAETANRLDHQFSEGAALVSSGTLDPAQALRFAMGDEAEFLRQEDEQSPLTTELPWALALHTLSSQEIQLELLSDSGAPTKRLLLLSFPGRESRFRLETMIQSRILHLEGHYGSGATLWISWMETDEPQRLAEKIREWDGLRSADSILLPEESSSTLLIAENWSTESSENFKKFLRMSCKELLRGVGTSLYPVDGVDGRTLLQSARERAATSGAVVP